METQTQGRAGWRRRWVSSTAVTAGAPRGDPLPIMRSRSTSQVTDRSRSSGDARVEEGEGGGASRLKYTLRHTGWEGTAESRTPPPTCKSHVPQTYPHDALHKHAHPSIHRLQTCSLVGLASTSKPSSVHAPLPSAVTVKDTTGWGLEDPDRGRHSGLARTGSQQCPAQASHIDMSPNPRPEPSAGGWAGAE